MGSPTALLRRINVANDAPRAITDTLLKRGWQIAVMYGDHTVFKPKEVITVGEALADAKTEAQRKKDEEIPFTVAKLSNMIEVDIETRCNRIVKQFKDPEKHPQGIRQRLNNLMQRSDTSNSDREFISEFMEENFPLVGAETKRKPLVIQSSYNDGVWTDTLSDGTKVFRKDNYSERAANKGMKGS